MAVALTERMVRPTLPPGPRLPRAAQTLAWIKRPGPWLERCRDEHGDTFTLRIAGQETWVVLSHPDAVREVFTADPATLRAGEANELLLPVLGPRSVLLLDGAEHLAERRLLLPPFHGERLKAYAALIDSVAEAEVAAWPRGSPVELLPRLRALTLEVILRAVFGVEDAGRRARLRAALEALLEWTTSPRRFAPMLLLGPRRVDRLGLLRGVLEPVDRLLAEEIASRRTAADRGRREDVLSLLLDARREDGSALTDAELRDELVTLLVAGHETTASALGWALERLVRHPAAWQRLRDEARAGESVYAEAVVRETLRLRPVLAIVLRRLTVPTTIAGHPLPAGISLAPCIHLVHRRAALYPDPHRFRPERFLETPPTTYGWIPFGGGIRRCLGASFALEEMRRVLSVVAARADLRPGEAGSEPTVRRAVTLAPGRGARVVALQR